jgi:hypothetical protein
MARAFVRSYWFPWFDLACALTAGGLWFLNRFGQYSWTLLLLGLLPWLLRLQSGRSPFRRTPFDPFLLLFLLTAAAGAWIAYNSHTALAKFWSIVGAIILFYAVAGQPRRNLWPIVRGIGWFGVLLAGFFVLTNDWYTFPPKFGVLERITAFWMAVRPIPSIYALRPNVVASLLAMTAPFLLAWMIKARERSSKRELWLAAGGFLLLLASLILTGSRGAWLALMAAGLVYMLWPFSGWLGRRASLSQRNLYSGLLLSISGLGILIALLTPGGPVALLDRLPGSASGTDRLNLDREMLSLIRDFPLTGGGLASFPGLYSQYIRVIPHYFLPDSHNYILDSILEQGLLGSVALVAIFLGSLYLLSRPLKPEKTEDGRIKVLRGLSMIRWATLASLMVMTLHGLVEDTIYGSRAVIFLFFLPGLVIATSGPRRSGLARTRSLGRPVVLAAGLGLILIALMVLTFHRPLLGNLYANLGALDMARVQLVGWPTGRWDEGHNVMALEPAEALFAQALQFDAANQTAHYRLGLIAMLQRDYETAVYHLEMAYQEANHRGIRKNLGYSYAWTGQLDKAQELLSTIPEAREELEIYSWWWSTQGQEDLALYAGRMLQLMDGGSSDQSQTL